ncbi:Leucine-rich repeats and immunoglobulin-like domains protein 1 [Nymphon striatum]|nr:Leucine-rich repeats and immunoglobulin-like domains protein 1 [Nymphon striatum]
MLAAVIFNPVLRDGCQGSNIDSKGLKRNLPLHSKNKLPKTNNKLFSSNNSVTLKSFIYTFCYFYKILINLYYITEKPLPPYLEDNTITIQNGEKFSVRAGESRTIHCISRKGNPPAIIKWFIDNVDVTRMATQTNSSDLQKPKTYQATSVLTYTYNKEHNMRTLKCSALHEMYPEKSLAVMVTLDVMYAPEISIQNKPENDIVEKTPLEVRCVADANPKANVMWKKAGNSAIYEVGERLRFNSIERKDSGIYSCSAKNAVGSSAVLELHIDVKYPPYILEVIPKSSQTVLVGGKTNLTCKAEGNPPPQYIWIQKWKGSPPMFKDRGHQSTLFIKNTTYDYQGKYVCKVTNKINGREVHKQSHEIELDVKETIGSKFKSNSPMSILPSALFSLDPLSAIIVVFKSSKRSLFLMKPIASAYLCPVVSLVCSDCYISARIELNTVLLRGIVVNMLGS